jgi:endonuclease/exonuclease/phosphatase family metal-dependent hydrolase
MMRRVAAMSGSTKAIIGWLIRLQLAVLAVLCAARARPLTIATYNVENYVATGRRVDGAYRQAYPKPEAAKSALRTVIRALDADVLGLQEMGPAGYLEELRRDLRAEGLDYPYAASVEAADTDRHVAALSRIPFRRVQAHSELEFPYSGGRARVKRGVLEIVLSGDGPELTLFLIHLRSRFTERADDPNAALYRAGEAGAVRDLVLRRFPDPGRAYFLILGDCNDNKNSRPLRLLTRRGDTRIAAMTKAVDPAGEAWTYAYGKEDTYSRVDYILASPALASAIAGDGARVYDGPGVREASDHRPVVVRLDLSGAAPGSRN